MEAKINKLGESHVGIMPIRVLQHNLIYAFENMNSGFLELSKKVIEELELDPGICYGHEEEAIKSPRVVFNKIVLEEPFLSYVWCNTFSLTVLYEEVIVKKSLNDYFANEAEVTNMQYAHDAYKLWEYAISLIEKYTEWDKQLPNPELYDTQYEELIPKVNGLYISAMKFVLAHEFAHIELRHSERSESNVDQSEQNTMFEKEADERAVKLVLEGINDENKVTINIGLLIGLCSLLFFNSVTKGRDYPDTDDRIDAVIKAINPDSQDAMWGLATLAYRLWDRLYDKKLEWQSGLESPRDLYNSIKNQIEYLK